MALAMIFLAPEPSINHPKQMAHRTQAKSQFELQSSPSLFVTSRCIAIGSKQFTYTYTHL